MSRFLTALFLLIAAPAIFVAGCKNRDTLTPIAAGELKKGAPPAAAAPVAPPAPPQKAAEAASGPKAWVMVPELGVKVQAPSGWAVSVPQPGYYTVKGGGQDGFVQVNKAEALPASPDEAAASRCIGPNAKTLVKEKTESGAIFVVCETELQGNKTRSINGWLKKPGAPDAAHCTITTDRNWTTLEPVCRSLSTI